MWRRRAGLSGRRSGAGLLALAVATGLVLTGCGDEGGEEPGDGSGTAGQERTHAPQPANPDGAPCQYSASGESAKAVDPPAATAAYAGTVQVTLETSAGDLDATLDASKAPCTVNSFTSLASQGYYDETPCHRLTTEGIYVLQCGDPTGTGSGGPGYAYPDELSGAETYPAGTLAMANAGPDTNGSQFFVVYAETQLPPSYTVFGTIDEASVQVVTDIADKGTADGTGDGAPADPVTLDFVEVGEAGAAAPAEPGAPTTTPTTTAPTAPTGTCTYTSDGTGGSGSAQVQAPPAEPTVEGQVRGRIQSSAGAIPFVLDAAATPCTVGSFVSLAQQGYFDGTSCHRLTTQGIQVLQCGDPTGTGTGGPGYQFPDELSGDETYPAGILAMANAGPDTNGSQFFIVYGETPLPPSYTVFGKVARAGLQVVERVARAGTVDVGPDGQPKTPVTFTKVTVG
ncbi:peptidylprolyl isomerase [Nocardioides litoris]|uniref:peptidylprolyl isomerase n=1 Tax=Nocardioides litoris TaxID=1926648 RepID=UPI0024827F3C|nr:peptidylprolyl isomerase [Nocardioides litoris]